MGAHRHPCQPGRLLGVREPDPGRDRPPGIVRVSIRPRPFSATVSGGENSQGRLLASSWWRLGWCRRACRTASRSILPRVPRKQRV